MLEIKGIKNGAVLQRDENDFCDITIFANFSGEPKISFGKLTKTSENEWKLSDIYIGGPYEITISDDVDNITFSDIYVGDLWLLAGQSNMEGAGYMNCDDFCENENPFIKAFYMDDNWANAKPVLHNLHISKDSAHKETCVFNAQNYKARGLTLYDEPPYNSRRRIGPGFYFVTEMFELTSGIPQGVIPTAVGGAPITKWLPISEGENYYTAAIRRIVETGSNIKGVFWAQGEGDADAKNYPAKIESIRIDLCKILDKSEIPFVQMQSFKCTTNIGDENTNKIWSNFREMQRNMPFNTNSLATIATNDLELDDLIHLSSDSQKIAGKRAANAMFYLLTGCGYAEPELDIVYITKGRYVPQLFTEIHIRYKNTAGSLKASGVPFGFAIKKINSKEEPSIKNIKRIFVSKNEVIISVEIPSEQLQDYELWYGYGNDFYCNITDGEGRAIPSMGPIYLKR